MKKRIFTFILALIAMPIATPDALAADGLKPIEAKYVCMVNDTAFDKEQIAVEVDGKTYYGCCSMCEARLQKDTAIRSAVDPVSGAEIDKAVAVIGEDANGKVYYFENTANLEAYQIKPHVDHTGMMNGHDDMMMHGDMNEMHHQMMDSSSDTTDLNKGTGVLNAVRNDANKINITHGPIPALQWPEMTMDLPVSDSVDLSSFNKGDQVRFFLKLDNKAYVIEKMEMMNDGHAHESGHNHHE